MSDRVFTCPGCRDNYGPLLVTSNHPATDRLCTVCREDLARLRGACLAMSRFLVWVELEAQATRKQHVYCDDTYDWREHCFWMALCRGRFRLVWP